MCVFKVLKWIIPDNMHLTSPDGVCVLKVENNNILVAWFNNAVLVTHISYNITTEEFSFGKTRILPSECKIVDVLQLGDVVGIFSKEMLYLLKYTNSVDKDESSSSKNKQDAHRSERNLNIVKYISLNGVLMLKALPSGFVFTKMKKHRIFVDVYDVGLKMTPVTKLFSVPLPTVAVEHASLACVMTAVKTEDLDYALIRLLLKDLALLAVEIVFIGLGNGQIFYVPVVRGENKSKSGGEPRILYSTTQSIKGILFLKGSRSELYSHIAIILSNGPLIHISSQKEKLHYETVYLSSRVHTFCQAGDSIVVGDGKDLWHCRLKFPNEFEEDDVSLVLESKMLKIKGVDALYYVSSANQVLALTIHLTLYSVLLNDVKEEVNAASKTKDFTIPSNLVEAINRQEERLLELHHQIAHEDKLLGIINTKKCSSLLRNSFDIDVQINALDGSRNPTSGFLKQYLLKLQLTNKSYQEFLPNTWSLHTVLLSKDLMFSETKLLKQKWSAKTDIEHILYITFPVTEPIKVVCHIAAEISSLNEIETESDTGRQWVTIPIAETKLDTSYFFKLLPFSCRSYSKVQDATMQVAQELLGIVKLHLGEGIFSSLSHSFDKQKELKEYVLSLTRNEAASLEELWSAITSNCSQQSANIVKTDSKMLLFIGSSLVKIILNEDCTELQLHSENLSLLHHVKIALMLLLRKHMSHNRQLFAVSTNLLTKTRKLKAQVHMLTSTDVNELQELRKEWRNIVNKSLPV